MAVGTSRSGMEDWISSSLTTRLQVYRETIKRVLAFPPDTNIVWKSHDDSIAQRSALDEARQQKASATPGHPGVERRRPTLHEDSEKSKGRGAS